MFVPQSAEQDKWRIKRWKYQYLFFCLLLLLLRFLGELLDCEDPDWCFVSVWTWWHRLYCPRKICQLQKTTFSIFQNCPRWLQETKNKVTRGIFYQEIRTIVSSLNPLPSGNSNANVNVSSQPTPRGQITMVIVATQTWHKDFGQQLPPPIFCLVCIDMNDFLSEHAKER